MVYILIHGTFASEAEWVHENAAIGIAIRNRWPQARIESFKWSGRNSHTARRQAGDELAARIRQLGTASDSIVLIAHSHGGNVALYAMKDCAVQELVQGCVFLGTPFLAVREREIRRLVPPICGLLPIAAVAAAAQPFPWQFRPFVIFVIAFFIGIMLAIPVTRRVIDKPWRILIQFVTQRLEKEQVRFSEHVCPPLLTKPSLVVSSRGDEAHIWLSTLNWASGIAFHPMPYVAACLRQWPLLLAIIVLTIGLDVYAGIESDIFATGVTWAGVIFFSSIPVFVALQFLAVLLPILFRGHRFGFGWEGLLAVAVVSVSPVDRPRSTKSVLMYEAPDAPDRKGMVHSFYYTNSAVARQIVTWLDSMSVHNTSLNEISPPIVLGPNAEASSSKSSLLRRAMLELRRPKVLARSMFACSALIGLSYAWYLESTPYIEEGYDKSKYVIEENIVGPISFSVNIPANSSVEKTFEVGQAIWYKHCHLIGHHEADNSRVSLFISLEELSIHMEHSTDKHPTVEVSYYTPTFYASPKGRKQVSFDSHLMLQTKDITPSGTVEFINNSSRKTAASLQFSIICLKDR